MSPHILELMSYKPGKPMEEVKREYNLEKVIKLASNENPFPIPENVSTAIIQEMSQINRYPDSDCYYVRGKIAEYNNIPRENVIVGAGSVEIICMIIRAFLKPGETVLTSEKSFEFYKIATIESAGKDAFLEAKMAEDLRFNLDNISQLSDNRTKIIIIANPNNPTGTLLSREEVYGFIEKLPQDKIVVLDNAYHEYVSSQADYPTGIDLAIKRKNIIVLRTFSKIYGLAGMRIGYAVSNHETISYLGRVKAPFNVTRLAQKAAVASLENDDFKNESAKLNTRNREKLFNQLRDMGLRVIPSETNFLLFFPGTDVEELNQRLLKEGVIIRPLQAFGIPDGMRVTVGFEEDNDYFIEKLKKCLAD